MRLLVFDISYIALRYIFTKDVSFTLFYIILHKTANDFVTPFTHRVTGMTTLQKT